jgi:multicomponent Na+:H+ antiporter subunit E
VLIGRACKVAALMALLWWSLAGNAGWGFGAVAIAAATLTSLFLATPRPRWSVWGTLRFVLYFLKESILAGIDVAKFAFGTRLSLHPRLLTYHLHVPVGPARTLFVLTINLLPGTLSAELTGDTVIVHVLDAPMDAGLERLEERIAGMFAIPWGELDNGGEEAS